MVSRRLRPGYDYLVARKLSSLWRDLAGSALQADLDRFVAAARELGFTERVGSAIASQVIARLLIATGRGLDELTPRVRRPRGCRPRREARTGRTWRHYRVACHSARQVLFHLGILDSPNPPATVPLSLEQRMAQIPDPLRAAFVGYLHRKSATCRPKTVSSLATRLAHFGRFLARPTPTSGRWRDWTVAGTSSRSSPPCSTLGASPPATRSASPTGPVASTPSATSWPRSPSGAGTTRRHGS